MSNNNPSHPAKYPSTSTRTLKSTSPDDPRSKQDQASRALPGEEQASTLTNNEDLQSSAPVMTDLRGTGADSVHVPDEGGYASSPAPQMLPPDNLVRLRTTRRDATGTINDNDWRMAQKELIYLETQGSYISDFDEKDFNKTVKKWAEQYMDKFAVVQDPEDTDFITRGCMNEYVEEEAE